MNLGALHVVAAVVALAVGIAVLVRSKGDAAHVATGRFYVAVLLVVNLPVFFLYDDTGRFGPFHLLAAISLTTTLLGWFAMKRRGRGRSAETVHATLMTWSWIGVATAGLAQLANRQWPEQSPWPVIAVVVTTTALGLVCVPRYVARQISARAGSPVRGPGRPEGR